MKEDWVECKLIDLFDISTGNTPSKNISEYYNSNDYPFYKPTDLEKGINVTYSNDFLSTKGFHASRIAVKNSVLVTCIGATIGKTGLIKADGGFNQQINAIHPNKYVLEKFLYFQVISAKFQQELISNSSSTTMPILNKSKFGELLFVLPPLPEQHAIVKKIEVLFSSLDNGIADLKRSQDQLKIYRQAVLKKAFEGELTKEWREKQTDLPTAEELKEGLKTIIDEALKNKNIAKGNYFPDYVNGSSGFNIPNRWNFFAIKAIVQPNKTSLKRGPFGSALKKEFFIEEGIPVYEQGHAINDEPFRHRYFISNEKYEELKGFMAGPNDLIISCSGATLGRICHLPENADTGIINQALLKISLNEKIILHKYFIIMFRSEIFQRLIFEKSLGTAMPNMVGMNELKDIAIPIPSIQEQAQIVKEIEARLSVCDAVEKQIQESLNQAEALRQSILKKAFEGTLLTEEEITSCKQEPDYEPASVLLAKIKAEKEANKPAKKKTTKKKTTE